MFAGRDPRGIGDDILYIALNTYWEDLNICLPELNTSSGLRWNTVIDTFEEESFMAEKTETPGTVTVRRRSIMVFHAVPFK